MSESEIFKAVEMRVAAYTELTAGEGRILYAAYVKRGLEIDKLREEIEALTHTGRQGELEQANVGLAEESNKLRDALTKLEADYKRMTNDFIQANKLVKDLRTALKKALNALQECRDFIKPRADERSWAWIDQAIEEVAAAKK